jgi:hypothetical protein
MTALEHAILYYGAEREPDGSYSDTHNTKSWYNEAGETHREDGPAVIFHSGDVRCDGVLWYGVRWYLNDNWYTFDDWLIELNKSDEQKMLLRLHYA